MWREDVQNNCSCDPNAQHSKHMRGGVNMISSVTQHSELDPVYCHHLSLEDCVYCTYSNTVDTELCKKSTPTFFHSPLVWGELLKIKCLLSTFCGWQPHLSAFSANRLQRASLRMGNDIHFNWKLLKNHCTTILLFLGNDQYINGDCIPISCRSA